MAYSPLTPSTWTGLGANATMNVVQTQYDLPPIEELYIRTMNRERIYFAEVLKSYGFAQGTAKPKVGHASVERPFDAPKFDSIVTAAGGAGNSMVLRIDAAYMTPTSTATVGGVAVYGSPLRVNDVIVLPNRHLARVKTKTASGAQHTFEIQPLTATDNLDSIILSGSLSTYVFPIITNAYADASNIGETKTRRVRKYENEFQIIKEQCVVSGGANAIELYHTNEDGDRGSVKRVHLEKVMRMSYDRARSYALLYGQKTTNTAIRQANPILGYDVPVKTTEGFIPFAETEGHDQGVDFVTYSLDNFRAMGLTYEQNFVGTTDFFYFGSHNALSSVSKNLLSSFDVTADRYLERIYTEMPNRSDDFNFASPEDYVLKVGFKQVHIDNYDFRLNTMHELNDPKGLGALTYYQNWGISAPMGFETDTESEQQMPMFGYQYLQLGQYSRESAVGQWGGFMATEARNVVNEWDINQQAIGCHIAAHMYNGNHFIVQHQS